MACCPNGTKNVPRIRPILSVPRVNYLDGVAAKRRLHLVARIDNNNSRLGAKKITTIAGV